MNEILESFGFDPILFAAQVVNFLILVFIFKKFLYKPLLTTVKEREDRISKGLEDAEQARIRLEQAENKKKEILRGTQAEADKIIESARVYSEELKQKALADTREEADQIVVEAREQARLEIEKLRKELKGISLEASRSILLRVVQGLFDKGDQEKILNKAIDALKKN